MSRRSAGGMVAHSVLSKVWRAAATAASMSAAVPSGTVAMTSSVCGEITSIRCEPVEAIHSPPM